MDLMSLSTYNLESSSDLNFVKNKKVIRLDGRISEANGLDWFESRMARPDRAVSGLARYLRGATDASEEMTYFRNIADDETSIVISKSSCSKTLPVCDASVSAEKIGMLDVDLNVPAASYAAPLETASAFVAVLFACSFAQ